MDGQGSQCRQPSNGTPQAGAMSSPGLSHPRRFDESWIEVSSQPSSSSLSSIGDEIVTTGLQVNDPYRRRRRRLQASARSMPQHHTVIHAAGASSQEEYDESESEDDALFNSSTENSRHLAGDEGEEREDSEGDSDDGDNATALGRASDRPIFRPQPNAFSHPPATVQRSQSTSSGMPPHPHSEFTRPSFSQRAQTRVHRGAPNFMSPSAREDNDAALRASLTTLLSCAAAARGLPKTRAEAEAQRASSNGVGPSNQPMAMRLIPESELLEEGEVPRPVPVSPPRKRSSPSRSPSRAALSSDKTKRSASATRNPRAAKKKAASALAADETMISPTLLTWVVSAGVVVLVSVVGFGAGYVIGREVGRQETLSASMSSVNETTQCGREVMRTSSGGLRRFRWGAVGKSLVAQA